MTFSNNIVKWLILHSNLKYEESFKSAAQIPEVISAILTYVENGNWPRAARSGHKNTQNGVK